MGVLVGYIRVVGDAKLDQAIEHELSQLPHITAIYTDSPGVPGQPGLTAALDSMRPSDCLALAQLSQLGLGLDGMLRFVDRLRYRGLHLVSLADGVDTTRDGLGFFLHLEALQRAAGDVACEAVATEKAPIPRGRKGGRKPALNPEQVLEAQIIMATRSNRIKVRHVAARFGVCRQTIYRQVVNAPEPDWVNLT